MTDPTRDTRPPKPPVRRCIVSINGVRCPEPPRYPGRDESSFCVVHDDPDNAETQAWQIANARREPNWRWHIRAARERLETVIDSMRAEGPEPNALTDIDRFLADALDDVPQGLTSRYTLAALSTTPDPLDAAWAAAEAALPEGWHIHDIVARAVGTRKWRAIASHESHVGLDDHLEREVGTGPTPAAALRALAEKLREYAKP